MTTDPQTTAWFDQEDANLARTIRVHRWAVQYVGAGEEPDEPAFGYTIGLFGLGHPELVVVGLGPAATHGVLDRVADLVVGGRDLMPGELLPVADTATRLLVETVPNPGEVVLGANRLYQRPAEVSVGALQLTWSDADGRVPSDPGHRGEEGPSPARGPGGRDVRFSRCRGPASAWTRVRSP